MLVPLYSHEITLYIAYKSFSIILWDVFLDDSLAVAMDFKW